VPNPASVIGADQVLAEAKVRHEQVGAYELSTTYESMQAMGQRKKDGVWYTPEVLAGVVTRLALNLGLDQVGPEPEHVLRIVACDPACGCGVFLVEAAWLLSHAYAERLIGREPAPELVAAVMPRVILECVFGLDIDPVAIDLARIALSIATGGVLPPEALVRHVVCGDPLQGDEPPAMTDRVGETPREVVDASA
jgi:hypothetical protein